MTDKELETFYTSIIDYDNKHTLTKGKFAEVIINKIEKGKFSSENLKLLKDYLIKNKPAEWKRLVDYIEFIIENKDDVLINKLQKDVLTFIAIKDENEASEVIVNYIEKINYIKTTIDDQKSEVWFYQDGIYKPNGESKIKEITRKILGKVYTSQRVNKIIEKIKADTQIDSDTFFNANYINEIPVKNGILNIRDKTLSKFTPSKIFFNKVPIEYMPNKKCHNIDKFLKDVLKDKDNTKVIEEFFGYCLYKDHFIEKGVMFIGNGRNGKSKTISLLKSFLGAENCCSVPLSQLIPDSFSVSELHAKLVNMAGDLSNTSLKETGLYKEIVGRDRIGVKRKFKTDLFFVNYSKQIFACNELPKVYDSSDGFWERWLLFEFPFKFVEKEVYNISEDKSKLKIIDTNIIDKLTTNEELSGFLNKALVGLDRILNNKRFSYSKSLTDIKDMWVRKSDSFQAFCMDNIEEEYYGYVPKKVIRKIFSDYCRKHKLKGASDIAIKARLENEYGVTIERLDLNKLGFSEQEYCWSGIKLKNDKWIKKENNIFTTCQPCQCISPIGKKSNLTIGLKTSTTLTNTKGKVSILDTISKYKAITFDRLKSETMLDNDNLYWELSILKKNGDIIEPNPNLYKVI